MRFKPVCVLGLLLLGLSEIVSGQASLPWLRSEQPIGPQAEEIPESQLPLARVRIQDSGERWVGRAISLQVEVIVPTWFTGAPRFPEIEVPNAVTLSPEAAVNFVVQTAGKTFAAQSRRYLIFPQAGGVYTVPPVKVEVAYAQADGSPSAPTALTSSSLMFEARVPPGAEGAKYFLTTKNFHIGQSFDRKLEGLKVGDSIVRTVSMTAEDTVGMTLPELHFDVPDGIRLYPGMPKVSEKAERGKIEATRTETATYVLEKEGRSTLPEIAVTWWNPQTKKMNKARLPAIELKIEANPAYSAEAFASSQEPEEKPVEEPRRTVLDRLKASVNWVMLFLGVVFTFLILRRILFSKGVSVRAYLTERKRRRADTEAAYFKRFRKASLSNDARASLRELMSWLDRTNTRLVASTLVQFARESGIPEVSKEGDTLNGLLFARTEKTEPMDFQGKWSGKSFYRVVARARKARIQRSKVPQSRGEPILLLNPGGTKGE